MASVKALTLAVLASCLLLGVAEADASAKKHHKHHGNHHKHAKDGHAAAASGAKAAQVKSQPADAVDKSAPKGEVVVSHGKGATAWKGLTTEVRPSDGKAAAAPSESQITEKMKVLEKQLAEKESKSKGVVKRGQIDVNGPLPADFAERFAQAVSAATGCDPVEVRVLETNAVSLLQAADKHLVVEVVFEAPSDVVNAVEQQVADPDSKIANGPLRSFLVADGDSGAAAAGFAASAAGDAATPVQEKGIDVDTQMPYGELEPFGREDTAQELTEQSVRESDEMVDQLERAEVAEEKRSVFRALTRLRGAAITSYDGIARAQTGNIDEYNKTHKWRKTHPLHHLADEESDISKWAFPDNADF